jgi:hypothetical protein
MGRRRHNALYPSTSAKNWYGPMPKWLKRFHHRIQRNMEREALASGEEPDRLKNGRIRNMWF